MTKEERKNRPMFTGLLAYFPDALAEVAYVSKQGQIQHGIEGPLHWDRNKSSDDPDAAVRHINDRAKGKVHDADGTYHLAKAAWRILATLQKELEAEDEAAGSAFYQDDEEQL